MKSDKVMKLIDKDALVAEIKRRLNHQVCLSVEREIREQLLSGLLLFIDTLEVKEVDLEKEYKDFIKNDNGRSMFETAKHFFELGLSVNSKAQKGEEV